MIKSFLTDEKNEFPDEKLEIDTVLSPMRRDMIAAGTASKESSSPSRRRKLDPASTKMSGNSIDYENS